VVLGLLTSFGMPKRKFTSKKINELILNTAEKNNIEIEKKYWPIGLMADHNPIINHGFEATMMGPMAMSVGVHTPKDNIENVSKEKLEEVGILSHKIIELFDKELD